MQVSLIVPMYNAQAYLKACLDSVGWQTVKNVEVILVDDCSTDQTLAIAQTYPYRIMRTDRNRGAGAARNYGVKEAKGEMIIFLDADMVLHADSVARLLSQLEQTDAVSALYTEDLADANFYTHFQNLTSIYRHSKLPKNTAVIFSFFLGIKKSMFDALGGFDETIPSYEDVDLGHRLAQQHYRCLLADNLQTLHIKTYSHTGLLREYWKKTSTAAAYSLQNLRSSKPNSDNLPVTLKLAGIAVFLSFIVCLLAPRWIAVGIGLYTIFIAPVVYYLAKRKGLVFSFKAYVYCIEIYAISIAAAIYGLLNSKQCLNS